MVANGITANFDEIPDKKLPISDDELQEHPSQKLLGGQLCGVCSTYIPKKQACLSLLRLTPGVTGQTPEFEK